MLQKFTIDYSIRDIIEMLLIMALCMRLDSILSRIDRNLGSIEQILKRFK